jgi:hypothetical protein
VKLNSAFIALNILLWAGCSGDHLAGGSSETENAVMARLLPVDSLLAAWNRPVGMATVAVLRLDSTALDFRLSDSLGLDLDVRRAKESPVPFELSHWDRRRRQGRLYVRIDSDLRQPGTAIQLWQQLPLAHRSDPAGVWAGIADSLRLNLTSVLVDDFESGSNRVRLPDSSTWFLGSGTGTVAAGGGRQGNALHMATTGSEPIVLAAALLASTPRHLGTIDSIVFWARGSGRLRVAMEHALAGSQLVAWTARDLDTAWRRVSVRPASFDSAAVSSGGARWADVLDSATHLSFWLEGQGEAWVDDPRLFGIDRDDLR